MTLELNRIHRMDALEGLKRLADNSIDIVVTDPPYAIASPHKSTIRHGKIVSTAEAWGSWDQFHPFDYDAWLQLILSQCYRVLRPGGAAYMFTSRENNGYFVRKAVQRGFTYRNQIILAKRSPLPSFTKTNWRSGFEIAFYVTKGKPKTFNFLSQPLCNNVYTYANNRHVTDHPTEKPLELITRMVQVSSNPGDLVLDPFMGSGTTAVAAAQTCRRFIGFELSAEYVAMAEGRLEGITVDGGATTAISPKEDEIRHKRTREVVRRGKAA